MILHKKDMDWTQILQTDKQTGGFLYTPSPNFVCGGGGITKLKALYL